MMVSHDVVLDVIPALLQYPYGVPTVYPYGMQARQCVLWLNVIVVVKKSGSNYFDTVMYIL